VDNILGGTLDDRNGDRDKNDLLDNNLGDGYMGNQH